MNSNVKGIHHITVCAAGAQEDVDFQTKVFGQRLIKQTVLFDGRYAHYHLYYANADAQPGSVYTTFPYKRVPGRPGSGQIQSTAYTIPKGAAKFWRDHLERHKIKHEGIRERFGQSFIRFSHRFGLATGSDRRFRGQSPRLDDRRNWRGRNHPRLPRAAIIGAGNFGNGAVFRRRARFPQDRNGRRVSPVRSWRGRRSRTIILIHEAGPAGGGLDLWCGNGAPHGA